MLLNQAEITKYKAFYPESVDEGVNKQSGQAVQHHTRTFGLPMTSDLPHCGVSCDSCRFYRRSLHARFRCWPNLRLNLIARSGLGTKTWKKERAHDYDTGYSTTKVAPSDIAWLQPGMSPVGRAGQVGPVQ